MRTLLDQVLSGAAQRRPEHPAVVHGDRVVTFGALESRANQLARLLVCELGVRRGDRVGILLDKSPESIACVYAVLRAGAAYVPLDDRAPAARLATMAADCGVRCLLTGRERAAFWRGLAGEDGPVRDLVVANAPAAACKPPPPGMRLHGTEAIDAQPALAPPSVALSVDLAYVLYTSGSTGRPKGVMLSHRNALAFVEWAAEAFGLGPDDRLSSHAPLHFDLSVFDVFAAALGGASTVLVDRGLAMLPQEIAALIERHGVTIWYSVPSILALLAQHGGLAEGRLSTLRTVLFAGEVFPSRHLRRLMTLLPRSSFYNLYGPTETNVCTWYRVPIPPADAEAIPIGRPVGDVEVCVVRDDGTPAAVGEAGELYVRGATVMQGYWGDEERTARSLVPNPWLPGLPDRVYRTGDLVRQDTAGDYWFLGRSDDQVKSRGHRIALGDVEAALSTHPSVDECAVIALPDESGTNRLMACVVARGEASGVELHRHCAERVPRYMVPERFELLPALPRTSAGKVDRRALAERAMGRDATS